VARARWLKPEFFTDAKVCAVSDQAALLFAALWVEADDGGVAPGDPRDLYGRRFLKRPLWDADVVAGGLQELADVGLIIAFTHRGEPYVLLPGFAKKQGVKPRTFRLLGADDHERISNGLIEEWNRVHPAFELDSKPVLRLSGLSRSLSQSPEPEPVPKPKPLSHDGGDGIQTTLTDDAATQYSELRASLPAAATPVAVGYVRAAQFPGAVVASIRALAPGGLEERPGVTWELVGKALQDMAAAGVRPFTANALRGFIRGAQRVPGSDAHEQVQGGLQKIAAGETV
jgi:hypothetical protein